MYKQGTYAVPITGVSAASAGSSLVSLNGSTDYIEIFQYNQNAATTNATSNTAQATFFSAVWVGPLS